MIQEPQLSPRDRATLHVVNCCTSVWEITFENDSNK